MDCSHIDLPDCIVLRNMGGLVSPITRNHSKTKKRSSYLCNFVMLYGVPFTIFHRKSQFVIRALVVIAFSQQKHTEILTGSMFHTFEMFMLRV